MDERERRGREYVEDIVGEAVPRATWPDGLRGQLVEFLEAAPGLLPPTHPKGPRALDHMPWRGHHPDVVLFEDPDLVGKPPVVTVAIDPVQLDPRPPVLAIRYAPEVVEEMRRRFGRHWPAEAPMLERAEFRRAMADHGVPDDLIGRAGMVFTGQEVSDPWAHMEDRAHAVGELWETGRIHVGEMTVTLEVELSADVESLAMRGYLPADDPLRHLLDWVDDYQTQRGWV